MRVFAICAVVVVVLLCIFVPAFLGMVRSAPGTANDAILRKMSDDYVVQQAKKELGEKMDFLGQRYVKIYAVRDKIQDIKHDMEAKKQQLEQEKQILARSCELLDSNKPGSTIVIGGTSHNWEDLFEDAKNQKHRCELLESAIKGDNASLGVYTQAYADGDRLVRAQREKLSSEEVQIDLAQIELEAERAVQEARVDSNSIMSGADNGSSMYLDTLRQRRQEAKALNSFYGGPGNRHISEASWEKELGLQKSTIDSIRAYVGKPKPAPTSAPR